MLFRYFSYRIVKYVFMHIINVSIIWHGSVDNICLCLQQPSIFMKQQILSSDECKSKTISKVLHICIIWHTFSVYRQVLVNALRHSFRVRLTFLFCYCNSPAWTYNYFQSRRRCGDDKKNGWCTPLIASISKVTKHSCGKECDVMMLYCMRNMYVTANSYFFL